MACNWLYCHLCCFSPCIICFSFTMGSKGNIINSINIYSIQIVLRNKKYKKMVLIKFFLPFGKLSKTQQTISIVIVGITMICIWETSKYLPPLKEVVMAFPTLITERDLDHHFIHSMKFCLTSVFYSFLIGLSFAYLSVIPIFRTFCLFARKFRFLPSIGLGFLFMQITPDIESRMMWMMVFGICVWMIDGMVGIALSITQDSVRYAMSLRLSHWKTFRELLLFGKAPDMMSAAISTFAISWTLLSAIENISKASGGIGVVIAESNKYFRLDQVYATQILILLTGIGIDFFLNKLRRWFFPFTKS